MLSRIVFLTHSMRSVSVPTSTAVSTVARPMPPIARVRLIARPVAIIDFDGMQSHRWAAPPTTSRSTMTTSAPRRAAVVAAMLPAGPPPMMRNRVAISAPRRRARRLRTARAAPASALSNVERTGGNVAGRTVTDSASRSRRSPTHSKCMPSGVRKLPPQAKPCLRKMRHRATVEVRGCTPLARPLVLVSIAIPHECRERKPSELSGVSRLNRARWQPPARLASADVDRPAEPGGGDLGEGGLNRRLHGVVAARPDRDRTVQQLAARRQVGVHPRRVLADRAVGVDPVGEFAERGLGLGHADRVVGVGGIPAPADPDRRRHESVGGNAELIADLDEKPQMTSAAQPRDAEAVAGLRGHQELGAAHLLVGEHGSNPEPDARTGPRHQQHRVACAGAAQARRQRTHHERVGCEVLRDVAAERAPDHVGRQDGGAHRIGEPRPAGPARRCCRGTARASRHWPTGRNPIGRAGAACCDRSLVRATSSRSSPEL